MKFEEMYIEENHSQKAEVIRVLNKNGFKIKKHLSFNEICESWDKFISTYKDGTYATFSECCIEDQYISYEDFMKKYDSCEMIELINKAKSELKMNDSELSLALGKSRQYIGKMLRLPQSKKVQDKVIKEISEFMDKVENPNKQNEATRNIELVSCDELSALRFQNDQATKQISDLKKANEQQKLVIDKLDDQLIKAEKIHNEDVKLLNAKDLTLNDLNDYCSELETKLAGSNINYSILSRKLNEIKSSHTTSKALNWFFVVAIILAAITWKAYNG